MVEPAVPEELGLFENLVLCLATGPLSLLLLGVKVALKA
jgi:hypothetical protein